MGFYPMFLHSVLGGLLWLVALMPLAAQGSNVAATIEGRLRNFSPNGRYAVSQVGNGLRVYQTGTWKASPTVTPEGDPPSRFDAVCVDDLGRVVAYNTRELRVYNFLGTPKLLFSIKNSEQFLAYPFLGGNQLLVRIIQVPPKPTSKEALEYTKVVWVTKAKFHETYFRYRIVPFSIPLATLVDACSKDVAASIQTPEAVESLRRWAVGSIHEEMVEGNASDNDRGSSASIQQVECTDTYSLFRIGFSRIYSQSCDGGVSECIRWARDWARLQYSAPMYAYRNLGTRDRPSYVLNTIGGVDCEFVSEHDRGEGPWQVVPKGRDHLPPFELGFVPMATSMDGSWVASYRATTVMGAPGGESTAIYAASRLADPYASYAPEVLQDLLLTKIIAFIKAKNPGAALPYFARLERTGVHQPESFYYYRMQALEDVGRKQESRTEAEGYLKRYGKKGEYYTEVIALLGRLPG